MFFTCCIIDIGDRGHGRSDTVVRRKGGTVCSVLAGGYFSLSKTVFRMRNQERLNAAYLGRRQLRRVRCRTATVTASCAAGRLKRLSSYLACGITGLSTLNKQRGTIGRMCLGEDEYTTKRASAKQLPSDLWCTHIGDTIAFLLRSPNIGRDMFGVSICRRLNRDKYWTSVFPFLEKKKRKLLTWTSTGGSSGTLAGSMATRGGILTPTALSSEGVGCPCPT